MTKEKKSQKAVLKCTIFSAKFQFDFF